MEKVATGFSFASGCAILAGHGMVIPLAGLFMLKAMFSFPPVFGVPLVLALGLMTAFTINRIPELTKDIKEDWAKLIKPSDEDDSTP